MGAPKALLAAGLAVVVGLAVAGVTLATTPDPPTLSWNKQIGSIWIGESYNRVQYEWGDHRETDSCVLMDETNGHCARIGSFFEHYKVGGGYIRVGFYRWHVVYIETTSPYYKTPSGIGVASSIPYAKKTRLDGVTFHNFTSIGGWQGWTKLVRYPRRANQSKRIYKRWVKAVSQTRDTFFFTRKGVVTDIWIVRGDVNLQL
jgi:hypothetical protein